MGLACLIGHALADYDMVVIKSTRHSYLHTVVDPQRLLREVSSKEFLMLGPQFLAAKQEIHTDIFRIYTGCPVAAFYDLLGQGAKQPACFWQPTSQVKVWFGCLVELARLFDCPVWFV